MPTIDNPQENTTRYHVLIGFTTRHPGYGDRTDQILAQVLTSHIARITIQDGLIVNATIDEFWDELHQVPVKVRNQLPPSKILEITIEQLNTNYPEAANLTKTDWTPEDLTTTVNVEEQVMQYTKNNWTITINTPNPGDPSFNIHVENTEGFSWDAEFFTEQLLE